MLPLTDKVSKVANRMTKTLTNVTFTAKVSNCDTKVSALDVSHDGMGQDLSAHTFPEHCVVD